MNNKGQTLVEVIVAVGIIVIVLVAVVAGVVQSVRNTRFAKEQATATRYAQETIEWLRRQRDELGWEPFYNLLDADAASGVVTYCLSSLPETSLIFEALLDKGASSCSQIGTSVFSREMTVTLAETQDSVDMVVRVSWQEGERAHNSELTGKLAKWE